MKMWPWRRRDPETRAANSYGDVVISQMLAGAEGVTCDPAATGAVEACSGLWADALAAAAVNPEARARGVTPGYLAQVGRALVRRGEHLAVISVAGDPLRVRLLPAAAWDVDGRSPDPSTWTYRVTLAAPSISEARTYPAAAVVHAKWNTDPNRPWCGISPLASATATAALASKLETVLGQEAGGPVGSFLPVPADGGDGGEDDPLAPLKSDIAKAKGHPVVVETTAAGWGEGRGSAPQRDFRPSRFGADPPVALVNLREQAQPAIWQACGVPAALLTDSDGTAQREAWRRFVMGRVEPLAARIAGELADKLDVDVAFNFADVWAHDLVGRAGAYKRLVDAGMPPDHAARIAGVSVEARP